MLGTSHHRIRQVLDPALTASRTTSEVVWWDDWDARFHASGTNGANGRCSECAEAATVTVKFRQLDGKEWLGSSAPDTLRGSISPRRTAPGAQRRRSPCCRRVVMTRRRRPDTSTPPPGRPPAPTGQQTRILAHHRLHHGGQHVVSGPRRHHRLVRAPGG